MKRAGEAALRVLRTRWPMAHVIVIVCGGGNNGGDGYVLARFAQAAGLEVRVLAAVPPAELRGDALRACEDFMASAGESGVQPFRRGGGSRAASVIVDALLGTGLNAAGARIDRRRDRRRSTRPAGRCWRSTSLRPVGDTRSAVG